MSEKVEELCRAIRSLGPFELARDLEEGLLKTAERLGWQVEQGLVVRYEGKGGLRRRGRLPLLAKLAGEGGVAIEIDRIIPRRKSLAKLAAVGGAVARVVVLRETPAPTFWVGDVRVFGVQVARRA